jgi:NAD(P)H-dependent flavin oxidoreductase YrpB (nitropropane dioxygenase family)
MSNRRRQQSAMASKSSLLKAGRPAVTTTAACRRMALVPEIIDAVSLSLVLAAGGIADGRGVAAALALGADGVWVGTRLVATPEAAVHPEHKRRIVEGKGADTLLCSIFGPEWPAFNPMRLLRNRVVNEWNDRLAEVPTARDNLPANRADEVPRPRDGNAQVQCHPCDR